MSRELPDQPDTLAMIEAAFGSRDILCNGAPGGAPARYLSDWIERLIAKRVEEAVRLEREACAKVCESYEGTLSECMGDIEGILAAAIRARSQEGQG